MRGLLGGFHADMPFFHNPTGAALSFSLITFNETIEKTGQFLLRGNIKELWGVPIFGWAKRSWVMVCICLTSQNSHPSLSHCFSMTHLSQDCSLRFQRLNLKLAWVDYCKIKAWIYQREGLNTALTYRPSRSLVCNPKHSNQLQLSSTIWISRAITGTSCYMCKSVTFGSLFSLELIRFF